MKNRPILILPGDQNSIFFEIFFKSLRALKLKSPLILISTYKILKSEMRKFEFKKDIKVFNLNGLNNIALNNKSINLIDIYKDKKKIFHPKIFLKDSFNLAFKLLDKKISYKFINGPINKSNFLDNKHLGITEFISHRFNKSKTAMLIYNKEISVCPATTHLPLKLVSKNINQRLIKDKTKLINHFYKKYIGFTPKIAVTGLNPHCESILKFNEDNKIIAPAINFLRKKGFKVYGPFPADTIFLKQNRKKYDVILGMYHDQVLSPIKTLKEYDAINITLGLPFFRISPDHGPNEKMMNKNSSNPLSLIQALKFLDKK